LGLRFGLFIKEGELELFVNGERCKAEVPELIGKGKKNFELKLRDGNVVKGWIGFKLADSLKSSFGFHTYRNKRLITFHDKIGISLNQKSKQLVGEIHIGHIPVTHNKRGWIKESREYKAFEKEFAEFLRNYDTESVKLVEGLAASPGRVEGTVRVLNTFMIGKERGQEAYEKVKEGDIIVTQMTRPDMLFYLQKAGAIVTDYGGVLSHAAIVSREFEIPCISGTQNATELLKDGQKVIVDATEGVVYSAE
jgi:phosphohistidine swiveling domain-containing protein